MTKYNFRIHFRIYGCALEVQDVVAYNVEKARQSLMKHYAGKVIQIKNVTNLGEYDGKRIPNEDQSTVISYDDFRRHRESLQESRPSAGNDGSSVTTSSSTSRDGEGDK